MQKTVWVIGAGQLGNMLQYAGAPLGIHVHPINVDDDAIAVPHLHNHHVVTAERERWPDTPAARALQQHPHFVNRDVFATLADRKSQKSLLDHLHLATARWMAVNESTSESELHAALGDTVLLKRRTGGYDGRGQHWLRSGEHGGVPAGWHNEAIAEEKIPFREEVSLIGARCADGSKVFYPLTLNLHVDGILMASVSPLPMVTSMVPPLTTMATSRSLFWLALMPSSDA